MKKKKKRTGSFPFDGDGRTWKGYFRLRSQLQQSSARRSLAAPEGRKEGSKQQNRTASMCVGSDGGGGVGGLQTEKETSGKKKEEVWRKRDLSIIGLSGPKWSVLLLCCCSNAAGGRPGRYRSSAATAPTNTWLGVCRYQVASSVPLAIFQTNNCTAAQAATWLWVYS